MPSEIADSGEFVRISERASECRVKRLKNEVKLKLRTRSKLYTIRLEPDKAAEILKQVKCEVIEA
jgi:large subunit ribosomal protein L38e